MVFDVDIADVLNLRHSILVTFNCKNKSKDKELQFLSLNKSEFELFNITLVIITADNCDNLNACDVCVTNSLIKATTTFNIFKKVIACDFADKCKCVYDNYFNSGQQKVCIHCYQCSCFKAVTDMGSDCAALLNIDTYASSDDFRYNCLRPSSNIVQVKCKSNEDKTRDDVLDGLNIDTFNDSQSSNLLDATDSCSLNDEDKVKKPNKKKTKKNKAKDTVDDAALSRTSKKRKSHHIEVDDDKKASTKKNKKKCMSVLDHELELSKYEEIEFLISKFRYDNKSLIINSRNQWLNMLLESVRRFDNKTETLECGHYSIKTISVFNPTMTRIFINSLSNVSNKTILSYIQRLFSLC